MKNNNNLVPIFISYFCPKMSNDHKSEPIDFFNNIFPESLINITITETNRYATQKK